jgi:hypothetical protein
MSKSDIANKLISCKRILETLLKKITKIEEDGQMSANDKISKIKTIREEITKVGSEIDSIKKEITLLNKHNVN